MCAAVVVEVDEYATINVIVFIYCYYYYFIIIIIHRNIVHARFHYLVFYLLASAYTLFVRSRPKSPPMNINIMCKWWMCV